MTMLDLLAFLLWMVSMVTCWVLGYNMGYAKCSRLWQVTSRKMTEAEIEQVRERVRNLRP